MSGSGVKRPPDDPGGSEGSSAAAPSAKKIMLESIRMGPVSTLEELDIQVLRFQHQKLKQRLQLRQRQENDLKERIEQLERRQTQDDAVLNVINRYWNQLNEDIRILLQRFDAEASNGTDDSENEGSSESTTSFLAQLSTWDKDELDEKLASRVQVSTRAVAKIIQAFDRLQQRNEKVTRTLKGELGEADDLPQGQIPALTLNEAIKEANVELEAENRRIHGLNLSLHDKYHAMSLKMKELQEKLSAEETKGEEYQNRVDDLNWDVSKLISQNDKLTNHLQDLTEKYRRLKTLYGQSSSSSSSTEKSLLPELSQTSKVEMSDRELVNLNKDNEELRELANNRLIELERLHLTQRETLKELEKVKMDLRQLPESIIVETTEYKGLQSKFSVVYNDNLQLRTTLDETKQQLCTLRTNHLKQIEQMESVELLDQKTLRTKMIHCEDMIGQVRREYEMLRVEYEQNVAANEQTEPVNREMRHLITSLQNHNQQLKGDAHRYRSKYKEMCTENQRLKRQLEELEETMQIVQKRDMPEEEEGNEEEKGGEKKEGEEEQKNEAGPSGSGGAGKGEKKGGESPQKLKKLQKKEGQLGGKAESENVKELRSQLKKAMNDQREMKLLLDMYKGASKDQRDKVQLMASERKSRLELEELKEAIKKLQDEEKQDEGTKLAGEDAMKRVKSLEAKVLTLQKQLTAQKQEEEALIGEMEVTGEAFEDMQEQNARLIQQLREKDDANFKLMSDRIKSNQLQKVAREEREVLETQQLATLTKQVEAQNQVVRTLEEKETLLLNTIASLEKEAVIRQQAMELHKRKAIESAQSAADLKLHLEKYHWQMKDAQQIVAEKTGALEAEAHKTQRLQEEMQMLRRKVERLNKIEMAGNRDEVMMEEIREYKETLTCPSCKVKRKDAVLIKCFHVFCFDCLRARYETRQRKCPKCNAAFGANDYHRLYLS